MVWDLDWRCTDPRRYPGIFLTLLHPPGLSRYVGSCLCSECFRATLQSYMSSPLSVSPFLLLFLFSLSQGLFCWCLLLPSVFLVSSLASARVFSVSAFCSLGSSVIHWCLSAFTFPQIHSLYLSHGNHHKTQIWFCHSPWCFQREKILSILSGCKHLKFSRLSIIYDFIL